MVISRKFGVRIADLYFDESPAPADVDVDVVRYVHWSKPVPEARCKSFHTVVVDLSPSEDWLIAHVRNNTRYEIKRADERDGLTYTYWTAPDDQIIEEFCNFYDDFALSKGRPGVSRFRLSHLAKANLLDISLVCQSRHEPLVWHASFRGKDVAGLLESSSFFRNKDLAFRNLVARANRYHHWRDMMRFKAEGILTYDFRGWVPNATSPEHIGINRFKEGFGGRIVENLICERALTFKGSVALGCEDLVKSLMHKKPLCKFGHRAARAARRSEALWTSARSRLVVQKQSLRNGKASLEDS